jgi:putative redox protein
MRGQKATARWSGTNVKFEVEAGTGHRGVMVDEHAPFGDDEGMRPTELLLGALGACTGVNAVLLLKKFKQPFRSLAVDVAGEQQEDWPHAFTRIEITFDIGWSGEFDEELADKALDLACNRYCPVDATLTNGTKITHTRKDSRS